ncbi:MAG TPA: hypothetical protein G4O10_02095 [Dehalococcoidia bacterium]|nr:hypothetical protein [Dehalococcoidia bacterium]
MGLPGIKVGTALRVLPKSCGAMHNVVHAVTRARSISVVLAVFLVVLLLAGSLSACKNADTLESGQTQQSDNGDSETAADEATLGEDDDVIEDPPDDEGVLVSFELEGWEVLSEADRAYLAVDFSCNTQLSLAVADTNGVKTSYFQQVEAGESSIELPMTSSPYETPASGTYSVIVHTLLGEPVTTVDLVVSQEPELTVKNVLFVGGVSTPIEAVVVDIENKGGLPAYAAIADLWIEDSHPWVAVDRVGVLPGETTAVFIELYTGSNPSSIFPVEVDVELQDSAGSVIVTHEANVNLIPMQTYANEVWEYAITHPVDWTVTEEGTSLESLLTIEDPTGEAMVIVEIQKRPGYRLDQWVDENNNTREDEWYSYEVLTNEEIIWHGFEAQEITWVGQVSRTSEVLQCHEICLSHDGWKYSIRGVTEESIFSTYAAQLDDIIYRFSLFS